MLKSPVTNFYSKMPQEVAFQDLPTSLYSYSSYCRWPFRAFRTFCLRSLQRSRQVWQHHQLTDSNAGHNIVSSNLRVIIGTRKPCCRKGTARCRSSGFWFKVRRQHSLRKPITSVLNQLVHSFVSSCNGETTL